MKKNLFLLLWMVAGCGLLHEKEVPSPTLHAQNPSEKCEIPPTKLLIDKEKATKELIFSAIGCLEKKFNTAFEKLHGRKENELSLGELKTLQDKGVVDFGIDSPAQWQILQEAMPLFHSEGNAALSKETIQFILNWARENTHLYLQLLESKLKRKELDWAFKKEVYHRVEHLLSVISPKFRMSLDQAKNLASNAYDYSLKWVRKPEWTKQEVLERLEGGWVLKSFFLEDTFEMGARGDLSGMALKKLIDLFFREIYSADLTVQWGLEGGLPQNIPQNLPLEWEQLARIFEDYISQGKFASLNRHVLSEAIRQLFLESSLTEFTADLIRVSQRLTDKAEVKPGLHPIALKKFLSKAKKVAQDLIDSAPLFSEKKCNGNSCEIPAREALKSPILRHIALKSSFHGYLSYVGAPLPKRLDHPILWTQVAGNLTDRALLTTIFDAFDSAGKGKIPLDSTYEDELKDTLDLAYTFLRFASRSSPKKNPESGKEESVPNYIMVKPDRLSKVIGLVGDKWMLDGDNDGYLNAEEFYSVTQVYEDIQTRANWAFSSNQSPLYFRTLPSSAYYHPFENPIRARKEFIQKNATAYQFNAHINQLLRSLDPKRRDSFFHALIGVPSHKEIEAYHYEWNVKTYQKKRILNYIETDASLAPTAVLLVLERLMHKCDVDENNTLDWLELDCAMPLILEAADETVSSELVNLDPGPHDGAKLILRFLRMKGIPLSLAKLIAINGGIQEFTLHKQYPDLVDWTNTHLSVTWDMLANFLAVSSGPLSPEMAKFWKHEAISRYGACDQFPKNNLLQGQKELDCFVETVIYQLTQSLSELFKTGVSSAALEKLGLHQKAEIFRLALKVSTQPPQEMNALFANFPMSSDPQKIVLILEEVIRRSVPLWQMQD